jgi:hypothetical protein
VILATSELMRRLEYVADQSPNSINQMAYGEDHALLSAVQAVRTGSGPLCAGRLGREVAELFAFASWRPKYGARMEARPRQA